MYWVILFSVVNLVIGEFNKSDVFYLLLINRLEQNDKNTIIWDLVVSIWFHLILTSLYLILSISTFSLPGYTKWAGNPFILTIYNLTEIPS